MPNRWLGGLPSLMRGEMPCRIGPRGGAYVLQILGRRRLVYVLRACHSSIPHGLRHSSLEGYMVERFWRGWSPFPIICTYHLRLASAMGDLSVRLERDSRDGPLTA